MPGKYSVPFILSFYLFFVSPASAQQRVIDSMRNVLKTEKDDSNKVNTFNKLSLKLWRTGKYDTSLIYAGNAQTLSEKINFKKGKAEAYANMGSVYTFQGNFAKAMEYDKLALATYEETGYKNGIATVIGNIGNVYRLQSNYPQAIDYYHGALKMAEEIKSKPLQASNLSNIGIIYKAQGDYNKALDYLLRSLKVNEELGDNQGQARCLGNIGNVYYSQKEYAKALEYDQKAVEMAEKAGNKQGQANFLCNMGSVYLDEKEYSRSLEYYQKALKMTEEMGDKPGQASDLCGIGLVYQNLGDYPKALDYTMKAEKIAEETGNKSMIAINYGNMGTMYTKTGKYKEAEEAFKKAIAIDSSIGDRDPMRTFEEGISQLYDTTGRSKLALLWYKKAMVLKDTLFNIDKNKEITRKAMTYEFDKKEASAKADQDKKDAIHNEELKKQQLVIYSVSGGLLLVLLLAITIFRSLQQNRKKTEIIITQKAEVEKKNKVIEEQKAIVEEKNKDILDSITYAKRLQDAILPPLSVIEKYLPESFVLYKPKDIVAGDFYWMERVGDNILIAAADCTGHGVPGAMVSVVCSNALNRTVKEFKITEPGKILDKTRELVLETFSQGDPFGEKSEANVQDGMDISLASLTPSEGGTTLSWAGAYNSLWYVEGAELKEIAGDKQPIGKMDNPKPFTTHTIKFPASLSPSRGKASERGVSEPSFGGQGGCLYLFTDGYADQFGGPKGKKFKYKQLSEKLTMISDMPMPEQKQILEETLESWKGSLEQVDDILIIGIRV